MKYFVLFLAVFINNATLIAQELATEIELEGKLLFRMEKGSWYGTDHFLENFNNKKDSIGGYLSYANENSRISTIFFSKYYSDQILIRYEFDSIPNVNPIQVDSLNKNATALEKDLISIRMDALDRINKNENGFFSFYKNTSLNLIPIISGKEKRVFTITGQQINGIVLLGNDYLLEYNIKNKFKKKKKIHNSIIELQAKSDDPSQNIKSTIHSHILSDYINSTDVCTLLLFKNFVDGNNIL